jgi:hypothetical protein
LNAAVTRAASHQTISKTETEAPAVTLGSAPPRVAISSIEAAIGSSLKLTTTAPNQIRSLPLRGKRPATSAPTIKKTDSSPSATSKMKVAAVRHPVTPASQRIWLETETPCILLETIPFSQRSLWPVLNISGALRRSEELALFQCRTETLFTTHCGTESDTRVPSERSYSIRRNCAMLRNLLYRDAINSGAGMSINSAKCF